jgi:hypothetical protein
MCGLIRWSRVLNRNVRLEVLLVIRALTAFIENKYNLELFLCILWKQFHYRSWQVLRVPGGWGSQILRQSAHEGVKVVSPMHRPPLPPGNNPGTHFCQRLSRPQCHSAAERIMPMKNSNDTIGNRSRDLPVCSAVPQPLRYRVPRVYGTSTDMEKVSSRKPSIRFTAAPTCCMVK